MMAEEQDPRTEFDDEFEDEDYEILGEAVDLTRNGKSNVTEANRGKGKG